MIETKERELKQIYAMVVIIFLVFLLILTVLLLGKPFGEGGSISLEHYADVAGGRGFAAAFGRSIFVFCAGMVLTTTLAFVLTYTIHYTNMPGGLKKSIRLAAVVPMLLPITTYGSTIIYFFGRQGFITGVIGHQMFEIYDPCGLLLGCVIYTLSISFMLTLNTVSSIDKKSMIVSRIIGDNPLRTFLATVIRPLLGTLAVFFVQYFFLCFTDFGMPASVGGQYDVAATVPYNKMLGSVPDFNRGVVVAMPMLIPSAMSISLLHFLERLNIRYSKVSGIELRKGRIRDICCEAASILILVSVLYIFAVIFVVLMVEEWPCRRQFTTKHIKTVSTDSKLLSVYENSTLVSIFTALTGSLVAYATALATARSQLNSRLKSVIESTALVMNTIPGMVVGTAFLLTFSGTPIQSALFIIVICNVMHFFSTPCLMMKSSLAKMNASWETIALLMESSWLRTVTRVMTPSAVSTLLEAFGYYFINAMVAVSAVIFIAEARTMVITTRIEELQYCTEFSEIFVLSLLILIANLAAEELLGYPAEGHCKNKRRKTIMENWKKAAAMGCLAAVLVAAAAATGRQKKEAQVVIYSNANGEAVEAVKHTLNGDGYRGKYLFQIFGISELGDKLLAEGMDTEADLVTMSSFYLENAQEQNHTFLNLISDAKPLEEYPAYYNPVTRQEGAIIPNTEMVKGHQFPTPPSIKDLVNPAYTDLISVTDIKSPSTAWLLVQTVISEHGEDGTKEVLSEVYQNTNPHTESSGSAPLKKIHVSEVAVNFGLRHQAVADKAGGPPVDYADPTEGDFSLIESAAVIDKEDKINKLAIEMAECIIKNGRQELLTTYPFPTYGGGTNNSKNQSAYPRVFPRKLTMDSPKKHQGLSESRK